MTLTVKSKTSLPRLVNDLLNRNMFTDMFDLNGNLMDFYGGAAMLPEANIVENDKDFKIELAAPGLERNDFKVEVDEGVLTISAEKKEEKKEEDKNYRRREFSYNSFSRSFTLPDNTLPDKIDAKYENGILRLSVPKKEMTISKSTKEIKVS